jgi:hypothetical protein
MALLGLQDDYVHDGHVLFEVINPTALRHSLGLRLAARDGRHSNRTVVIHSYAGYVSCGKCDMVSKVIFGVLLFGRLGFGQFETSEVLGTVRDASEKPVAEIHGAVVRVALPRRS